MRYTRQQTATGEYTPPLITDVHLIDFDFCCALDEVTLAIGGGSLGFQAPGTNGDPSGFHDLKTFTIKFYNIESGTDVRTPV